MAGVTLERQYTRYEFRATEHGLVYIVRRYVSDHQGSRCKVIIERKALQDLPTRIYVKDKELYARNIKHAELLIAEDLEAFLDGEA